MKTVIIIAGLAGSGKSTLAKQIARTFALRYVSGGYLFEKVKEDPAWWETHGAEYNKNREKDPSADLAVDEMIKREAEKGDVVIDSKTAPWLIKEGFKIWLDADLDTRAKRVSQRSNISVDEAKTRIRNRDEFDRQLYLKLYGFDIFKDKTPFNFVISTDFLTAEEVFLLVSSALRSANYV